MAKPSKIKLLFVCHGNICRSPMAEFYFRSLVRKCGLADSFEVASAATSSEELGNPVYPLAKRTLAEHGIGCQGKVAQQLTPAMYDEYDYLLAMDGENLRNIERIMRCKTLPKVARLLDFVSVEHGGQRDVADPWYTRDFAQAWSDIATGCNALLRHLAAENGIAIKDAEND